MSSTSSIPCVYHISYTMITFVEEPVNYRNTKGGCINGCTSIACFRSADSIFRTFHVEGLHIKQDSYNELNWNNSLNYFLCWLFKVEINLFWRYQKYDPSEGKYSTAFCTYRFFSIIIILSCLYVKMEYLQVINWHIIQNILKLFDEIFKI